MGDGEYGSTTTVKLYAGISPTDTVDDTIISNFVTRANRKVDNDLADVVETIPVASAAITDDLTLASNFYATRLYAQFRHSFDKADQFKQTYDETIKGVHNRLKSLPTVRTKLRAMTKDYITEPLASDPLLD